MVSTTELERSEAEEEGEGDGLLSGWGDGDSWEAPGAEVLCRVENACSDLIFSRDPFAGLGRGSPIWSEVATSVSKM